MLCNRFTTLHTLCFEHSYDHVQFQENDLMETDELANNQVTILFSVIL